MFALLYRLFVFPFAESDQLLPGGIHQLQLIMCPFFVCRDESEAADIHWAVRFLICCVLLLSYHALLL